MAVFQSPELLAPAATSPAFVPINTLFVPVALWPAVLPMAMVSVAAFEPVPIATAALPYALPPVIAVAAVPLAFESRPNALDPIPA